MDKKNISYSDKNSNDSNGAVSRREFISGTVSAAVGLTVVPSFVLGGSKHIAPSDKINVAYIGTGTQGLSEMPGMLEIPEIQITTVCDPQKNAIGYYHWDPTSI